MGGVFVDIDVRLVRQNLGVEQCIQPDHNNDANRHKGHQEVYVAVFGDADTLRRLNRAEEGQKIEPYSDNQQCNQKPDGL